MDKLKSIDRDEIKQMLEGSRDGSFEHYALIRSEITIGLLLAQNDQLVEAINQLIEERGND